MPILDQPLRALAAGLRERKFSSLDLWHEARATMDASEPRLNAYKLRLDADAERAAREADASFAAGRDRGMLQGIPVSVKDLYGVPGSPTFAGSARALPAKWQEAGPLVRCLLEEHAVIVGKTHTVEFAFGGLGLNTHWPVPRNPWDEKHARVAGGSSSGAGVSLYQGSAVIALGSDTAGSVRIPAALTGNAGYKPTIDRWSTRGIAPLSPTFDTPGVLARSVDDAFIAAAEFDRRMFGDRPGALDRVKPAERLRIGVPEEHFWDECDADVARIVRGALAELEKAGHRLVPIAFPEATGAYDHFRAGSFTGVELLAFLKRELPEWLPLLDPNVAARMEALAKMPAVELLERKQAFEQLAAQAVGRFGEVDVIAAPTVPIPAPRVDEIADYDRYRALNMAVLRNTCVANLLRLCALTLPAGLHPTGLPVALMLMAAPMRDDVLFGAGLAIERTLGPGRERLKR